MQKLVKDYSCKVHLPQKCQDILSTEGISAQTIVDAYLIERFGIVEHVISEDVRQEDGTLKKRDRRKFFTDREDLL